MFEYASILDVYEIKLYILCLSIAVAIWLGNKFYNNRNRK